MASTSKVPYLIDAFRQWAMDFSFTPQLIIDGSHPDLVVPFDKILMTEGEFVLNIADRAIDGFVCRGEEILFDDALTILKFRSKQSLGHSHPRRAMVFVW